MVTRHRRQHAAVRAGRTAVGAHEQTEHVQHLLASTSNNVEALAKEVTKKNGEDQWKNMSAAEKEGEAGMRFETPNRFKILGVESEGEESFFFQRKQSTNSPRSQDRTKIRQKCTRWARTHIPGSEGTTKEKNTELQILENWSWRGDGEWT